MTKVRMLMNHTAMETVADGDRKISQRKPLLAGDIYEGPKATDLVDARKAEYVIEKAPTKKTPAAKREKKVIKPAVKKAVKKPADK